MQSGDQYLPTVGMVTTGTWYGSIRNPVLIATSSSTAEWGEPATDLYSPGYDSLIKENSEIKKQYETAMRRIKFLESKVNELWFSPMPGPGFQECADRFESGNYSTTNVETAPTRSFEDFITFTDADAPN